MPGYDVSNFSLGEGIARAPDAKKDKGLTLAQTKALRWLAERGGTGLFEKNSQTLVAAGELALIMRQTWNKLRDLGKVTIVGSRVTIVKKEGK